MGKRTTEFLPPVTYQGGKGRLAARIVEEVGLPIAGRFFDLCCGSGAVSVAAVERGQPPKQITMVDLSPWGLFWKAIGEGSFDIDQFEKIAKQVPRDPWKIKEHVEALSREPVGGDLVYVFLILQAARFGGAAVWIEDGRWRGGGFRQYWTSATSKKTPTRGRDNPNSTPPMCPMPDVIVARCKELSKRMLGVVGICTDLGAADVSSPYADGDVAYIDPPYTGTSKYGYALNVVSFASSLPIPCWASEGHALTENATCLSTGRTKGGMSGNRAKEPNQEWLSMFGGECRDSASTG